MGRVDRHDVADVPRDVTLRRAMIPAAERDSVAREYTTDFEVTFTVGLPALRAAWETGAAAVGGVVRGAAFPGAALADAVLDCFLTILAEVPDTLIARKRGLDTARRVSARAAEVRTAVRAGGAAGRRALAAYDAELRDPGHTLNPGTTADLVTAAVFVFLAEEGMLDRVSTDAAGLSPPTGGEHGSTSSAGEGLRE